MLFWVLQKRNFKTGVSCLCEISTVKSLSGDRMPPVPEGDEVSLINPMLWLRESSKSFRRLRRYERDRQRRMRTYASAGLEFARHDEIVAQLQQDGFAVIPQAFDRDRLASVRIDLESQLNRGKSLRPVTRDAARQPGERERTASRLTDEEIARGQDYCRHQTNHVAVANPMVNCPSIVPLCFAPLLIDIAAGYFDCIPAIGGFNLRKSFVNNLPAFDTLHFHVDPNSPRFLKFFLYLNDVSVQGGPFCYVRGSHRRKFVGWTRQHRWTRQEIERHYLPTDIIDLTASMGDLIVADTTGFHRGNKAVSLDRAMLTVDYVVHPEFNGRQPTAAFQVCQEHVANMTAKQRAVADFLEVVPERRARAA